ncbi:uncharacterized protein LOC131630999 [Vicia villosa]|uniref:uncharacterized protein LOC131630999 n=1 Tax=Vicia villosa TaxID=3911 RepID=UPI00273C29DB|nr:uncharacterized protein LOC131630999 [Vicia villosa]
MEDVAESLSAVALSLIDKLNQSKAATSSSKQKKWTRKRGVRKVEEVQRLAKEVEGGKRQLVKVQISEGSLMEIGGGEKKRKQYKGIYDFPEEQNKRKTWELLMDLNTYDGEGLICFGDFNDISNNLENQGGNVRTQAQFHWSRLAMEVCNLTEIDFASYRYTWSNGREDKENIQCRLDRGLINPIFLEKFPGSKVSHLPRFRSDHAAIQIDILEKVPSEIPRRKYLFIFEEAWSKDPHCEELVKRCWREPMSNVRPKLNALQGLQVRFKEYRTGAISKETKRVEGLMQKDVCWMPNSQSIAKHRALERQRNKLLRIEETMQRQRSMAVWLRDGDRNTKFFHGKADQRRKTNAIKKLKDKDGNWRRGKLSEDHKVWCGLAYTGEEVKEAIWQMHPSKSPGPDGFLAFFFQKYWSIVGIEVMHLVLEVLNGNLKKKVTGNRGMMAVKLDMSKACDRIEWEFVTGALEAMGFPIQMIHLIKRYDSLIFARANQKEVEGILSVLSRYQKASGQMVNLDKSQVSFSKNMGSEACEMVRQGLGMVYVVNHGTYLGLPVILGRQGGPSKLVAQAIPNYIMSCYKLSEGICKEIEALLAKFWWGAKDGVRKMHWMSWERFSFAKCNGGMGFRGIEEFNKSLLGKQYWRLLNDETSLLARVFEGRYYPRGTVSEEKVGFSPSYAWRNLLSAKEMVESGTRWRIRDGFKVKIWYDNWIPTNPGFKAPSPRRGIEENSMVNELIDSDLGRWKTDILSEVFNQNEAVQIASIPLSSRLREDKRI